MIETTERQRSEHLITTFGNQVRLNRVFSSKLNGRLQPVRRSRHAERDQRLRHVRKAGPLLPLPDLSGPDRYSFNHYNLVNTSRAQK